MEIHALTAGGKINSKLKRINVNVGILGHVDCGKTTLAKALSTIGSTAAFDANPQSQERGITIDLGFSSFPLGEKWNFTLVDCPGHASLIRTVIGGIQIMDIMVLCIDIKKGLQTQGQECLTIAELTCEHLIIVVTKVDLIEPCDREKKIVKTRANISQGMSKTKFRDSPIVFVSSTDVAVGVDELKNALLEKVESVKLVRDYNSPFMMAVDHCFTIKGQGTVLTGTILQGSVKANDSIEIPALNIVKKVKSMQSFRVPIKEAMAGDRVGICVPGLDATKIERGLIAKPGFVHTGVTAGVITLNKVHHFKTPIRSEQAYQVSIGYENVETKITLFKPRSNCKVYKVEDEYEYVQNIEEDIGKEGSSEPYPYFAFALFKVPITVNPKALVIGADLASTGSTSCRIAFSGSLEHCTSDKDPKETYLKTLNIFRNKSKVGKVERIRNAGEFLVTGFCKKESVVQHLLGLKVVVETEGEADGKSPSFPGKIESRFGQTTKMLVRLDNLLSDEDLEHFKDKAKYMKVCLNYKKRLFCKGNLTQ